MLVGVLTRQVNRQVAWTDADGKHGHHGRTFRSRCWRPPPSRLVLRLLGTDKLIEGWVTALPGGDTRPTAAILGAIFVAAFVLDAFEIIFVAVPILIPSLLIRVPDAVWISTLVLLTLQASFLLPRSATH